MEGNLAAGRGRAAAGEIALDGEGGGTAREGECKKEAQ